MYLKIIHFHGFTAISTLLMNNRVYVTKLSTKIYQSLRITEYQKKHMQYFSIELSIVYNYCNLLRIIPMINADDAI
jgi:hypothetical protein